MSGLISAENAQCEVFRVRILRCRSMASNPGIFSKRPFIAAWLSLASLSACGSPELPAQTGTTKSGDGDKAVSPVETEESRRALHQYLQGRYLYQKHCTECHGETGRGNGPWAAELEIKPRNFRTGLFKLRTTPYGMLPMEEDLMRTIKGGISGTSMPVFGHLPDADIRMIIKYLQSLSRSWKDPSLTAAPLPIPEVPGWFSSKEQSRQQVENGRARFAELCAACHGESGKGDGPAAGQLIDAWGNSAFPADLSAAHHKSGDSPRDLYRSIATGLNGTPMVGFAGQLSETEIWELISFIRQLGER